MPAVIIGKDAETGQAISIGDIERRSGLYILGRPGSGKSTLLKSLCVQDMANGHGVFFLDPHGDAIEDLQQRIPAKRQEDVIVLDPADALYSFGMNLLACPDPSNMTALTRTFAPAIEVFKKLFANLQTEELDILLNQYLRNSFFPLIANQGYTLSEMPLFLSDKAFRDRLLQHPSIRPQVVRFWRDVFDRLDPDEKRKEIASTLRRLEFFEDYDQIRHIVGQSVSTLHFSDIMDTGKILFIKLSATLPPDVKRIIGTMLVSNLVHAVLQREQMPEDQRRHFCIFVDEFQNFASSDDFAVLFTQARKYALATTIAHQERYGQFADNKRISGATDAAVNKIFFQVSVRDAREQAAEFAKETTTTETRLEPELVISQEPLNDLLRRGHANPRIQELVNLRLRQILDQVELYRNKIEGARIEKADLMDQATIYQDQAGIDRIDAQMERRTGGYSLTNAMASVENAMAFHTEANTVTGEIKAYFNYYQSIKKSIHNINRFLNALMEGRVSPEDYADFFADVSMGEDIDTPYIGVYYLYLQLRYGDPKIPRYIPTLLAVKYFWDELVEVYKQIHIHKYHTARKNRKNIMLESAEEVDEMMSLQALHKERVIITKHSKPYVTIWDNLFPDGGLPIYLPDLPARSLTPDEIERIKGLCCEELSIDYLLWANQLDEMCYLLQKPENHIKISSGQYVEKQVHVRPVHDMTDEMAQELIGLQPHTAYVKSSWKGKIQTLGVAQAPGGQFVDVTVSARNNAIANGIVKPRTDIEEEIRDRQENWRKRPGNEPPPPTHTGGNTPPSLPSARRDSDSEPPPSNTTSEEKPPGNSALTQSRTGIAAVGEAKRSQEGKVIALSSYQQKRRENETDYSVSSSQTGFMRVSA